jgi:Fe2+ or Zn2+ uptake regulation protein
MLNIEIVNWLLSQNGKGDKGFTVNEIYHGLRESRSVCRLSVYNNVAVLKKNGLVIVANDGIPLRFKLHPSKFKG